MIRAYPVVGKAKAEVICKAFVDGAPRDAKGAVFYGVNETNHREWHIAQAQGDWYYIDNSYFDKVRGQQYRVTKNRVQIDPRAKGSDGKRFAALGIPIAPMNLRASNLWVIVEQSPSFMKYVAAEPKWLDHATTGVPAGHRIVRRRWVADKLRQQETLPAALADAWTLVTYSSAAAVTAACLGVPVIVSPMSALYHMRVSTQVEHDERHRYMSVLADNQWTLDEIRNGDAWQWLNP